MTTTDPTPLAEQIAREHLAILNTSTWLIVGCSCDPALTAPANGVAGSWYAEHIATVTERAVRERIEDEVMLREIYRAALRQLGTNPDEIDAAFREGLNAPPEELGASVSPVYLTNGVTDD